MKVALVTGLWLLSGSCSFAFVRPGVALKRSSRSGTIVEAGGKGGKLLETPSFENPVPVLNEIFDKMYGKTGYSIKWGVFKEEVDPSSLPSAAEQKSLRAEAAAALTNIDATERDRRQVAGTVATVATIGLSVLLPFAGVGLPQRFAAEIFPVFLAYGFLQSAKEGL